MFKVDAYMKDAGTVLRCEGLTFTVGGATILQDVSTSFEQGRFYSIAGCNGSGKTTLLQNILHIKKPSKGRLVVSQKVDNMAHYFSYVPQNTQLEFDFTVEEVVMMGRYPYFSGITGPDKVDKAMVAEAIELTDMGRFRKRSVKNLSGGEKQRTIIARALAQDTPLMLLDEPVSQLDVYHQMEVLNLLRRITDEKGKTIVTVLHDLNQVAEYTDEVLIMDEGRLVAKGNPYEVLTPQLLLETFRIKAEWICSHENKPHLVFHYQTKR